ncbi:MAG: hypothetical protein LBQ80_05600 [Clostridium sp.]|jgi:hypothetical protein|nr:hypothetical protein [Clostridium sp.]
MGKVLNQLRQKLNNKGISCSIVGGDLSILELEVTQFFTNSSCAVTWNNVAWRQTRLPKSYGRLGVFRILAEDSGQVAFLADVPCGTLTPEEFNQVANQMQNLIRQSDFNLFANGGVIEKSAGNVPSIFLNLNLNPGADIADFADTMIGIMPLELLRIYGGCPLVAQKIAANV